MFAATDTEWAPWHIVDNDDKKRGRLNIISHLLSQIPYEPLAPRDVKMPKPPSAGGYVEPESSLRQHPDAVLARGPTAVDTETRTGDDRHDRGVGQR